MNKPVGGDSELTEKESLDHVAKIKNVSPSTLYKLPKLNPAFLYLFDWFSELKRGGPLTFSEIQAWSNLCGVKPNKAELEILFKLDAIYIEISNA